MDFYSGSGGLPCLVVHGGAGRRDRASERWHREQVDAEEIAKKAFHILRNGDSAAEAVLAAVRALEANPLFNAGFGAALQSDGVARLSASYMDGPKQTFSAVAMVENLIHPVELAKALQTRRNRVLGPLGADALATELGTPRQSPITEESHALLEKTLAEKDPRSTGTVGAVAVDIRGRLVAATSTGGYGADVPWRMSDVSSAAGNYASSYLAVSCTGVGEQIVDAGLAVRLETRVRDGMSLKEAAEKCFAEAKEREHEYAWIAVDKQGNWVAAHTMPSLCFAMRSIDA